PRFRTLDDLNGWLLDECVAYAKKQAHPEFKGKTIFAVFEAERASLIGYRGPFDSYRWTSASVSKTCLVRVDNNQYSVEASAVGRPVDVYVYADRIVLRQDGRIVGEHDRCFARNKRIYWRENPARCGTEPRSRAGSCQARSAACTTSSRPSRMATARWSTCS